MQDYRDNSSLNVTQVDHAKYLKHEKIANISITNRTFAKAEALAKNYEIKAVSFVDLEKIAKERVGGNQAGWGA